MSIMKARPVRARRSVLISPGDDRHKMEKAAATEVDVVLLDLEDSVSEDGKDAARAQACAAARELTWRAPSLGVRVNALDTRWGVRDVVAVMEGAGDIWDLITLPKAMGPDDVRFMDMALTGLEAAADLPPGRVGLEIMIEESRAIGCVEAIALAAPGRLEALVFGPGDYAASQGVEALDIGAGSSAVEGDAWRFQRHRIAAAARAAGAEAVDGPWADFEDPAGFMLEARRARAAGFTGKWVIHPSQASLAREAFTSSSADLERARAILASWEAGRKEGRGVVRFGDVMVDAATARMARAILDRAAFYATQDARLALASAASTQ